MKRKILFTYGRGLSLVILFISSIFNVMAQTASIPSDFKIDYLAPASYIIENVEVVGNRLLDPEALLAISGLRVGDSIRLPGPAITIALERLWQEKIIKNVSVYVSQVIDDRITLSIHVVENPRLSTYIFTGVTKREEKELSEKINLVRGKIVTSKLMKNVGETLKKEFIGQGYKDVQVEISAIPDPIDPNYNQLKIYIHKGEKFIVNKIIIRGNNNLSSPLLKAHLEHFKERPRFTLVRDILYKICTLQPIRKGGILWNKPSLEQTIVYFKSHFIPFPSKFLKQNYLADKKRLIQYYHNQGYKDATIVKDRVYKVGQGLLNIALDIEEGQKYYFGTINWAGNYIHDSKTLNKILNIKPGDVYNPTLLNERLIFNPAGRDITSLYMDDGYLFFNVEPIEVKVEDNNVDLELRIYEGTQATINSIDIRGNIHTHENVIRRELKTLPGDKFSRAKLIRSQRELAMLNVFDPYKMGITPLPNSANNSVDLVYRVKEAPKFDVKGGVSLSSESNVEVYADLGTNNFSLNNLLHGKLPIGDVQSLHITARFRGRYHQDFALQFIEPWLTGKQPTSLSLSINKSFQQHVGESSALESRQKNNENQAGFLGSFGVKAVLGKRLTWPDDYFTLKTGVGYRFYNYERYNVLQNDKEMNGHTHDLSFEVVLERNSLDQVNYPTKGSSVNLQCRFTPPYSLFSQTASAKRDIKEELKKKEYHQTILDINYFYNLFGEWVLSLFGNGGVLGSYPSKKNIGPFERFCMGGKNLADFSLLGKEFISLRGYPAEYIKPRDRKTDYEGGVLFEKLGLEFRHPIIKSTMLFVYGLAFAEAGNTWAHYADWKLTDLKKSVGVGIRFYLPMFGAVGLDWGHGFDKAGTDKLEFHFSAGAGIR